MTLNIVPSTGMPTAWYPASAATRSACANAAPSQVTHPASPPASPFMNWEKMTPLLPRAPQQHPASDGAAHRADVRRCFVRQWGLVPRAQGEEHVDARIAVRDGKYVECVDGVDVSLHVRRAGEHELPEVVRVEGGKGSSHGLANAPCSCYTLEKDVYRRLILWTAAVVGNTDIHGKL